MWAVYRLEEGIRMWYVGIPGDWSSVAARACRWPDKRDAQAVSAYVRGCVAECESTRKVIQIAATTDTNSALDVCYALCDDGSIWHLVDPTTLNTGRAWRRLPGIPQEKMDD